MSSAWDSIVGFFERFPYVEALAIIVVFMLAARLVDRSITGFVRQVEIGRAHV